MLTRFASLIRCPPTMIRAGSPGTNRTIKNTTEVIKNISGINVSNLVTMSRVKLDHQMAEHLDADRSADWYACRGTVCRAHCPRFPGRYVGSLHPMTDAYKCPKTTSRRRAAFVAHTIDPVEELQQDRPVTRVILEVTTVGTALEDFQLRIANAVVHRPRARRIDFIELTDRDQRRHVDLAEPVSSVELDQISRARELVWAPHGVVDRCCHVRDRSLQRFRPRCDATNVASVKLVETRQILWMAVVLGRFIPCHHHLRIRRELLAPAIHPRNAFARTCGARGQRQASQLVAVMQRVFERQKGAPRLSEQVHRAETERLTHGLDLVHEAGHSPNRDIIRFVRPPRPELIV